MSSTLDIQAKFSGLLIASEGPVFAYLADVGIGEAIFLTNNNQVDPTRYPTSARTIRRLRACAPAGTGTGTLVFTLYKNGAATAMTCTIPSGQPPGSKAADGAHPVVFADGDDFDLRVDGTSLEANYQVSAVLEGPPPGP